MKSFILLGLILLTLLSGCVREEPTLEVTDEAMVAGESNPLIELFQPNYYLSPSIKVDTNCCKGVYEIDLDQDGHIDFELTSSICTTKTCEEEIKRLYITCFHSEVMVVSNTDMNLKKLNAGDSINCRQVWSTSSLIDFYKYVRYTPHCGSGQFIYGNWHYVSHTYIGLRVRKSYNSFPLYGWLKISVNGMNITVEEIASQVLKK